MYNGMGEDNKNKKYIVLEIHAIIEYSTMTGSGVTCVSNSHNVKVQLLLKALGDLHSALAAVATSQQLSPLFTGDATDGAMNRHYNQVGAAITRVTTAAAGAGPGVAGNVRPSLSYPSFTEPAMTA